MKNRKNTIKYSIEYKLKKKKFKSPFLISFSILIMWFPKLVGQENMESFLNVKKRGLHENCELVNNKLLDLNIAYKDRLYFIDKNKLEKYIKKYEPEFYKNLEKYKNLDKETSEIYIQNFDKLNSYILKNRCESQQANNCSYVQLCNSYLSSIYYEALNTGKTNFFGVIKLLPKYNGYPPNLNYTKYEFTLGEWINYLDKYNSLSILKELNNISSFESIIETTKRLKKENSRLFFLDKHKELLNKQLLTLEEYDLKVKNMQEKFPGRFTNQDRIDKGKEDLIQDIANKKIIDDAYKKGEYDDFEFKFCFSFLKLSVLDDKYEVSNYYDIENQETLEKWYLNFNSSKDIFQRYEYDDSWGHRKIEYLTKEEIEKKDAKIIPKLIEEINSETRVKEQYGFKFGFYMNDDKFADYKNRYNRHEDLVKAVENYQRTLKIKLYEYTNSLLSRKEERNWNIAIQELKKYASKNPNDKEHIQNIKKIEVSIKYAKDYNRISKQMNKSQSEIALLYNKTNKNKIFQAYTKNMPELYSNYQQSVNTDKIYYWEKLANKINEKMNTLSNENINTKEIEKLCKKAKSLKEFINAIGITLS
ncbi:hypothetical protein [uncultured Lutibacter sp.]|uniref:hypothetical protein n=1 Tax=uncultured Lutibacter sp. TaxID=437739 RepID=UPI002623A875|nr:hypothetical protein [uncultured Lutibacter sp.]